MSVYEYMIEEVPQDAHVELWEEDEQDIMESARIPMDADTIWREVRSIYTDHTTSPVMIQIYV